MNKLRCEGVGVDRLLLTLPEAAKALSVATRTVRRLMERGELPKVKIGRCVRVPAEALQAWVDKEVMHAHNRTSAGSGVRGKEVNACQSAEKIWTESTSVPIPPSIARLTPTRAARELDALLGYESPLRGGGKRRPS
jgi:excisionase family DNA binding protein